MWTSKNPADVPACDVFRHPPCWPGGQSSIHKSMTTPERAPSRRSLMLAVALLAVIAAVLVATLGDGRSHHAGRATAASSGRSVAQAAASYLGLSRSELRRRLHNGETLEEIARSTPHHSAQGLLASVTAARA